MKLNKLTIILIAVLFYFYLTRRIREGLENVEDYKKNLANDILGYIKSDTTYTDYLQFLIDKQNRSYKLLDNDIFTEFRLLAKKNILTVDDILKEMDDVK